MKLLVCDGPGPWKDKIEFAQFTGCPVVDQGACDSLALDPEDVVYALEAAGNQSCVLVPRETLSDDSRAELVDRWGFRVSFHWFNAYIQVP